MEDNTTSTIQPPTQDNTDIGVPKTESDITESKRTDSVQQSETSIDPEIKDEPQIESNEEEEENRSKNSREEVAMKNGENNDENIRTIEETAGKIEETNAENISEVNHEVVETNEETEKVTVEEIIEETVEPKKSAEISLEAPENVMGDQEETQSNAEGDYEAVSNDNNDEERGPMLVKAGPQETIIESVQENVLAEKQGVEQSEVTVQPPQSTQSTEMTLLHEDVKKIIEEYITNLGISDYTLKTSSASDKGDNFSGFIGKLEINGFKSGTPISHNWIVKTAPHLEIFRNVLNVEKVYSREVYMYTKLFPLLQSYQNEANVLEPFDNHPKYILSCLDPMKESVVMQDMKSLGYILRPRQKPLDLNHVKFVVKAYAKLHALSFALKKQKPEVFEELKSNTTNVLIQGMNNEIVYSMQKPFMCKAVQVLDPKNDAKYLAKFTKFSDKFLEVYVDKAGKSSEFEVILHADCWINNLLWMYQDERVEKVCLIDWQLSYCGSPAYDISYFLFTSTTKEFRDRYFESMLRLYHYTLCSHLNEFEVNPEEVFPFEALKREMKTFGVVGLYASIFVLCLMLKNNDEIPDWRDGGLDTNSFTKGYAKSGERSEEESARIRGVIIDVCEKGYLDYLQ